MLHERLELGRRPEIVLEKYDGSVQFRRLLSSPSRFAVLVVVLLRVLVLDDFECCARFLASFDDVLELSGFLADGAVRILSLVEILFDAGDDASFAVDMTTGKDGWGFGLEVRSMGRVSEEERKRERKEMADELTSSKQIKHSETSPFKNDLRASFLNASSPPAN